MYIYTPYHWVKELVREKHIEVRFIPTKQNLADIFTKPVPREVVAELLDKVTGYNLEWMGDTDKSVTHHAQLCAKMSTIEMCSRF